MAEKLPFIQLFTGDWLKDPCVRMLSTSARGIWWDLICIMHESGRSGVIAGTADMLSRAVGCPTSEMNGAINEFQVCRTCAVETDDNNGVVTLTCRRMAREARERELAANRQERHRERKSAEPEKPAVTPEVTAVSRPILHTSEVRKEGYDKASKREAGGMVKSGLTVRQAEVAAMAESVLNGQWINDAGKWIGRIKANPEKVWRVMADVRCAATERRIKTSPAQMAEFNWGVFK